MPGLRERIAENGIALDRDVRELLARMLTISEVAAAQIQPSTGKTKATGGERPPGPEESLFDVWVARFNQAAGDEQRTRRLLHFARAELHRHTGEGMPAIVRMRGVTPEGEVDAATEHATIEDILTLGQGMDPVELAAIISEDGKGYCPPSYVRRVRARNGLHPMTGAELPPPDKRLQHALRLLQEPGATQRKVAAEMGVAESTLSRWLTAMRAQHDHFEAA